MLNCHQTFPFKSVLEWVQLSFTVQLWRFGIMNDSETLWDRFGSADLNQAISAKWCPLSHPQTLHSMRVTQTFRNVLIHQRSGNAELCLLGTLGQCGKWKISSNSVFNWNTYFVIIFLWFSHYILQSTHYYNISTPHCSVIHKEKVFDQAPINQWSNVTG